MNLFKLAHCFQATFAINELELVPFYWIWVSKYFTGHLNFSILISPSVVLVASPWESFVGNQSTENQTDPRHAENCISLVAMRFPQPRGGHNNYPPTLWYDNDQEV